MWKYGVEQGRPQITIQLMRIVTNTHSEYVIVITFPCDTRRELKIPVGCRLMISYS